MTTDVFEDLSSKSLPVLLLSISTVIAKGLLRVERRVCFGWGFGCSDSGS